MRSNEERLTDMFFSVVRMIVRFLVLVLNGTVRVENKNKLPKDSTYILVAPHRSWIDPVPLVLASAPDQFTFMAKKELFENPMLRWLITKMNAFPIDRKNPGPSAIKTPVKALKDKNLNVMIFPTGSRHSNDLKGGALTIARMSGKPIVPAVFVGPYTMKDLLKRKKMIIRFGDPIYVDRKTKLTKETIEVLGNGIQNAFDQLESEVITKK